MMATTSATLWPGMMWGSTARFEKDAPRHFMRYGFGPPAGTQGQPTPPRGPSTPPPPPAFPPPLPLALGPPPLPHRLHARPRGDRSFRQPVEDLAHDPDRLAELLHPHAIARVAVPRRLHRHLEVEVLVRGI